MASRKKSILYTEKQLDQQDNALAQWPCNNFYSNFHKRLNHSRRAYQENVLRDSIWPDFIVLQESKNTKRLASCLSCMQK